MYGYVCDVYMYIYIHIWYTRYPDDSDAHVGASGLSPQELFHSLLLSLSQALGVSGLNLCLVRVLARKLEI